MADNVNLTAGDGTIIAGTDTIGGVAYPRAKVVWGPDGTVNDADVATGKPLPVQVRSATGLIPIGEPTDAKSTATDTTSVTGISIWKQISASIQNVATALGSAALSLGSGTIGAATLRVALATDSPGITQVGQTTKSASLPVTLPTDQTYPTGMSPRAFSAAFSTLTRPANTTAYAAGDSISDNGTAGSVTALTATVGDTNDDPLTITEILVHSTDTGLAGKRVRAYLYNANPTSSSGVGGGDNAAFANKKAGYIGSFSGVMESGFSDGTPGRLVPTFADGAAASTPHAPAGGFVVSVPTSGAKTLFVQFQAVDGFTPSANSTTIIATARGFQGRAA